MAPITSAFDPDLGVVSRFIQEMLSRGAVVALAAAIVALLRRMRDLNTELMKKLASKSRKRPPNEAMRRLQMELPLVCTAAANDAKPALPGEKKSKKRGARRPKAHGRPKLPAHLPRVPNVLLVPAAKRRCPSCNVEVERICIKTTAEKLEVEPSKFIVSQTQLETCACPECHQYIVTADKGDGCRSRHPPQRAARSGPGRPLPGRGALGADGAKRPPRGRTSGSQYAGVFRRQPHRSV